PKTAPISQKSYEEWITDMEAAYTKLQVFINYQPARPAEEPPAYSTLASNDLNTHQEAYYRARIALIEKLTKEKPNESWYKIQEIADGRLKEYRDRVATLTASRSPT